MSKRIGADIIEELRVGWRAKLSQLQWLHELVKGREHPKGIVALLAQEIRQLRKETKGEIPNLLENAQLTLDLFQEHLKAQNQKNASSKRRPKVTDEKALARRKAKDLWPEVLKKIPCGHGQKSRAITSIMQVEYTSGKKIGDVLTHNSLRQTLTRKNNSL